MTEGKVILVTGGTGLVGRGVQWVSEQEPRADERVFHDRLTRGQTP